jgi:hypothetical protein
MDYERFDRDAIRYYVGCDYNGTRFYLAQSGGYTDLPHRAAEYIDATTATLSALSLRADTSALGVNHRVFRSVLGREPF